VLLYYSRWSYLPDLGNGLRLRAGDVVKVVDRSHGEWWYGVTLGSAGYFPAAYVTPAGRPATAQSSVVRP